MIISRFLIKVNIGGGCYGKSHDLPLMLEIGEAFLISKMKGERHFEYIISDITQEDAIRIADSIGVEVDLVDDHYTFHADIDTNQIQQLDNRMNMYSIRYTLYLCERAAYGRIRRDLYDLNEKPPLWAIEALIRIIRRSPSSKIAIDARKLIKSVISLYNEYSYLATWF